MTDNKKALRGVTGRVVFVAISVVVFVAGCGDNGTLSGKWKADTDERWNSGICGELEFQGKSFTFTNERSTDHGVEYSIPDFVRGRLAIAAVNSESYRGVASGTYSLSGNQIELKFSDGTIEVRSFSRTENTIKIGSNIFTRT